MFDGLKGLENPHAKLISSLTLWDAII